MLKMFLAGFHFRSYRNYLVMMSWTSTAERNSGLLLTRILVLLFLLYCIMSARFGGGVGVKVIYLQAAVITVQALFCMQMQSYNFAIIVYRIVLIYILSYMQICFIMMHHIYSIVNRF